MGLYDGADAESARIAARDFGVLHQSEALAAGHTVDGVGRRVRSGRWEKLLHKTYGMPGSPDCWEKRGMAACKWAGPGSGLSFGAAARVFEIRDFGRADIEISTVGSKRPHGVDFKIHRCDQFLPQELTRYRGLPVTSGRRTILDLFGIKHARARRVLDQMLREGKESLARLWLFLEEEWLRGRRGCGLLREELLERTPELALTDEDLASELLVIIGKASYPEPVREYPFELPSGPIRFDLAYPDRLLAFEGDGYTTHGDHNGLDRDRERDSEAALFGWLVVRYTSAQIRFKADYVERNIGQHLELRPPGFAQTWATAHKL